MQTLLHNFFQDIQYAFRRLWKSPGFTITAVLTLAIGIGVNTASFSVMDAVVLRPLAVPDLDHVVTVYQQRANGDQEQVALANFADWQRQSTSFEELAVRKPADMSLTGAGDATSVQGESVSPNFFSVMRANAFLGRVFNADEAQPGRNDVTVLSYGFWKAHFASDPRVVGRRIELDQRAYTIIGVMPKNMQYPAAGDFFLPFAPTDAEWNNRSARDYLVIGRLRKGLTLAQARAELKVIGQHLAQAYPATNRDLQVKVQTLLSDMNSDQTPLYSNLIQGATFFVLLVVCANIANLQFARGIARRPEIAMRTALGAGRGRLMRQLLTENMLLGLVGGAGGLLFAAEYMHLTQISMPERIARFLAGWDNMSLNGRTLALSLFLALLAGLVSGFAPALEALRINLVDQLKSGSRSVVGTGRSGKMRNVLAVSQIALAVALVIGATLMCKGLLGMMHLPDRYQPAQMLTFQVHLPGVRYPSAQKQAAWYHDSLDRLRALPGVESAEATNALPYSDSAWLDDTQIENRPLAPGQARTALHMSVSPGYFGAFHIATVAGRMFGPSDDLRTQPVAVVSREFANRYFPGENALGRKIRLGAAGPGQTPWMTIVGVAGETTYSLWDRARPPAVYLDAAQQPQTDMTYAVTTKSDPEAMASAVRKALAFIDPALPLAQVESYEHLTRENLTGLFYVEAMLGFDAAVALLLAAIGIFGVMANLVGERTREIGVRLALGARREDVLRMILRRAGWLTGVGICTGLVLAFALAHGVANLFYEVSPNDPWIFTGITAAITLVAFLASWFPASRAAHTDPMVALRDQ